jgi:hypothetical protein
VVVLLCKKTNRLTPPRPRPGSSAGEGSEAGKFSQHVNVLNEAVDRVEQQMGCARRYQRMQLLTYLLRGAEDAGVLQHVRTAVGLLNQRASSARALFACSSTATKTHFDIG